MGNENRNMPNQQPLARPAEAAKFGDGNESSGVPEWLARKNEIEAATKPEAGEDWHEDAAKPEIEYPSHLAGLYRVTHGTLFFNAKKIVRSGRTVRLTAKEAYHHLHLDVEEDASQGVVRPKPMIEKVHAAANQG